MGLVLKYVQRTKKGAWRYRRRVPDDLRPILGKAEITKVLGDTEREALKAYPSVHQKVETEFRRARNTASLAGKSRPLSELEIQKRLVERFQGEGLNPYTSGYIDVDGVSVLDRPDWDRIAYGILESYPMDPRTGEPVGMSEEDARFVRALFSGELPPQPAPTLEDAKKFYLQEKVLVGTDKENKQKRLRVERVIKHATDALGGDRKITEIRRQDARLIRDHFKNELGVKAATAKRYLTDLKAIVSLAIREFEINSTNPFEKLTVETEGSGKDDRRPFTHSEVTAIRKRLQEHAKPDLQLIWAILEGTGCRVGEISGLLKNDVVLDQVEVPHIRIIPHEHRGLKNKASARSIPLVGETLKAVKEALAGAGDSPYLFPHYALNRGNDRASAALMKHVRSVVSDPKVTNHSLRHRMADRLRLAGVSEDVLKMILGHASKGITERYGGVEARLTLMKEALEKVC
ncbi:tyrosine-type recombinase/integrase [Celeribacter ethanolicus]|nr:tyrosine-type recombinase/integrase [Celeribacter ethanolicus]